MTDPAQEPEAVAFTNAAQLGFLRDPAYAEIPMAMWAKRSDSYGDIPLYTSAVSPRQNAMPPSGLPYGIIDPDYARFFTDARLACWSYGYALAMHGSFTRDLDLIAMPWIDAACDAEKLIQQIEHRTEWNRLPGKECSIREHGRMVWTLTSPKFNCSRFVDFSVVPRGTRQMDREALARIVFFASEDGLEHNTPQNDALWNAWKDKPETAECWKAADAILVLIEGRT